MPFIADILPYHSLSIIGTEKNTGKTECLNYVLGRLQHTGKRVGVTSIGIDGEQTDQVSQTAKPEIALYKNMLFATSEKHYKMRQIVSEVVGIGREATGLGRVVTAKTHSSGKVLLSGPATNAALGRLMDDMRLQHGVDLCLVDGALSRKSAASPALSQATILATGAAYSASLPVLLRHTCYIYDLICLEQVSSEWANALSSKQGIWAKDAQDHWHALSCSSAFQMEPSENLGQYGKCFYLSGALNNRFLQAAMQACGQGTEIIVSDFSKIFVQAELFYDYLRRGGKMQVLQKTKLIAVCVNPTSPSGYILHSEKLVAALEEKLGIPVYDIKKEGLSCN